MASSDETAARPRRASSGSPRASARASRASTTGAGCASALACARFNGADHDAAARGCLDGSARRGRRPPPTSPSRGCPAPSSCRCCARAFATAEAGYDAVVAPRRGHPRRDRPLRRRRGRVRAGHPGGRASSRACPSSSACSPASTLGQALERSAPDETNKGREAARAAVEMARLLERPPAAVTGAAADRRPRRGVVAAFDAREGLGGRASTTARRSRSTRPQLADGVADDRGRPPRRRRGRAVAPRAAARRPTSTVR